VWGVRGRRRQLAGVVLRLPGQLFEVAVHGRGICHAVGVPAIPVNVIVELPIQTGQVWLSPVGGTGVFRFLH